MTNLEDALLAVDAGADAVGFVFYEKSPRCVSMETARQIVQELPKEVEKVGVFVNEAEDMLCELAERTGLTAIQMHGDRRGSARCGPGEGEATGVEGSCGNFNGSRKSGWVGDEVASGCRSRFSCRLRGRFQARRDGQDFRLAYVRAHAGKD